MIARIQRDLGTLWVVFASLILALGCASTQMTRASVSLDVPLEGSCMVDQLRSEPDVVDFRMVREGGAPTYWFEIADPALGGDGAPSFLARQKIESGEARFEITSSFRVARHASKLREAVMQRQQLMLSRVLEKCTGHTPRFARPGLCGKGEADTLCVEGEVH